jgi:hypothetical protein
MRQALFAVVLVAASFAGGAVVNGPGLRWAQTAVMNRLGLHPDDDENADAHKPGTAAAAGAGVADVDGIPASPIPPLVVEPSLAVPARPVEKNKVKESPGPARDKDKPSSSPSSLPSSEGPHAPEPGVVANVPEPTPAPPPAPAPAPPPETVALPSASGIEVPVLERPEPLSASPREPGAQSRAPDNTTPLKARPTPESIRKDAAVALASLAGKAASSSSSDSPAVSPPTATAPGEPTDWTGVRGALRDLGVSRYGIEGEPNGRVRFHCVIPLAGRRAVSQHFEAEGDDELQAARAVLRRITLWRATEAEGAGRAP